MNKPNRILDIAYAVFLLACATAAYALYTLLTFPARAWGWAVKLWRLE